MPEQPEEFKCRICGSSDFYAHIDETITAFIDGYGDVQEYGDSHNTLNTWNYPYVCGGCGEQYSSIPAKSSEDEWLETKKRHYLNIHGVRCPLCGSDSIEGGSVDANGSTAWQYCSCGECGTEWNDVYHLKEVEIISYPDDMVPPSVKELPTSIPNPNNAFKEKEDE